MRYFAYGSNMLRARLVNRVGAVSAGTMAWVSGYRLAFEKRSVDGSAKCNMLHTAESADSVYGVLFDLTPAQRQALDRFEGAGYTTCVRPVSVAAGTVEAYFYTADPAYLVSNLLPYDWYKAFVVAGARESALPARYIDGIDAVPSLPDPDCRRAEHNHQILQQSQPRLGAALLRYGRPLTTGY